MRSFFTTARYRPHNRKDRRYDLPQLQLTLGNMAFTTYDWSLGGFRIDDFKGRPPVGEMMEVSHIAYGVESSAAVKSTVVVTRLLVGKNQVAFAFNKLDEKAYELLENASMRRLSRLAKK
ncbi:MAG: PilZ domain-containing protein [Sneathiella sp.]|nr:PilZ domain-containing protein [Sneathiella sp.]